MRSVLWNFLDIHNVRRFYIVNDGSSISSLIRIALQRAGYLVTTPLSQSFNPLITSHSTQSTKNMVALPIHSQSSGNSCHIHNRIEDFDPSSIIPSIIINQSSRSVVESSNCLQLPNSKIDELIDLICYSGALQDAESENSSANFGQHLISNNQIFYETDLSLALVNIRPVLPGHALIIPRRRVPRFTNLTQDEVSDLWNTARKVGAVLEKHFQATSLTMTIQDGPEAGQSVSHVHIHILPRNKTDKFQRNNDEIYEAIDSSGYKNPTKSLDPHTGGPQSRSEKEMSAEALLFRALCKQLT